MNMKIYFDQRKGHRETQKDTVKYAPKEIINVNKSFLKINNIDHISVKISKLRLFISKITQTIPIIQFSSIRCKDLIYSWNKIPIYGKYILELENPYALTYYNSFGVKLYRTLLKILLRQKRCKAINCMSVACKLNFLKEFGNDLEYKTNVFYPYAKKNTLRKHKNINFIFVGTNFNLKGGRELIKAFSEIDNSKITLTLIGVEGKSKDKRMKFLGKMPRKEIFNKYYPNSDVLVFPTTYESFGLVALEALSFGLGIITTNTYALPEFVKHNKNGYLINNPYIKGEDISNHFFANVTKLTITEFENKYLSKFSIELYVELKKAMLIAIDNYTNWKNESEKIFSEKFDDKVWKENFKSLLKCVE